MKVWTLKLTPDYEQPTEHGVFVSPEAAKDTFIELVRENVLKFRNEFSLIVTTDAENPGITVMFNSYDAVAVTGVHVKGTGRLQEPSVADQRSLAQVVLDVLHEAASEHGFTHMSVADGIWVLRQAD